MSVAIGMITVSCDVCGQSVEVEPIEAASPVPEWYIDAEESSELIGWEVDRDGNATCPVCLASEESANEEGEDEE